MTSAAPAAGDIPEEQTHCIFICGAYESLIIYILPVKQLLAENDRVTWGYEGPNTEAPLIVFNKTDQTWWKEVPYDKTKAVPKLLLNKLRSIGKTVKHPDKVSLFIFCHGSRLEWLRLGEGHLEMDILSSNILKEFKYGVQVKIIVAACYSGLLLDMIKDREDRRRNIRTSVNIKVSASGYWRGSPSVTAYTSSLALGLKAAQNKTPARSLQQHVDSVNNLAISASEGVRRKNDAVEDFVELLEDCDSCLPSFLKPLPSTSRCERCAGQIWCRLVRELFLLPNGITAEEFKQWAEIAESRYTHIRDIFEEAFGKDTWGSATKFLDLLKKEIYKANTLEEYLGPRWCQGENYIDEMSPTSGTSSSILSKVTTASSASSVTPTAGDLLRQSRRSGEALTSMF
ncbi:hypothetical protein SVAN01_01030 [Stagonosporopsis vannaccii]|nr:hypothetical protein SVAN01_01030 [Stagonosporopsis vannaccii]